MQDEATPDRIIARLLDRHGRTYASEAKIRLERNTPAPLFQLLCLSLLISARIGADIAVAAARALFDAGWTTADKMASASWEARTKVLNQAGYARYDESTSRYLEATAELLLDRHGGDLRELRQTAGGDANELRAGLMGHKGVGGVGADVFIREVQRVWPEFEPFVDGRTLQTARELGLPDTAAGLRSAVGDVETFTRLVAALVRSRLAGDHDDLLDEAGRR